MPPYAPYTPNVGSHTRNPFFSSSRWNLLLFLQGLASLGHCLVPHICLLNNLLFRLTSHDRQGWVQ